MLGMVYSIVHEVFHVLISHVTRGQLDTPVQLQPLHLDYQEAGRWAEVERYGGILQMLQRGPNAEVVHYIVRATEEYGEVDKDYEPIKCREAHDGLRCRKFRLALNPIRLANEHKANHELSAMVEHVGGTCYLIFSQYWC